MASGRLLAITGGHRFDLDAFSEMLDAVCDTSGLGDGPTPPSRSAQRWLRAEHAGTWDAIVLHDIPGLTWRAAPSRSPHEPSAEVARRLCSVCSPPGQGIVATHHALAGWPAWDDWAGVLGGRFLYAPRPAPRRRRPGVRLPDGHLPCRRRRS